MSNEVNNLLIGEDYLSLNANTILIYNVIGGFSMAKYFKWAAIAIVITIAYGGMYLLIFKFFTFDLNAVETTTAISEYKDNPTPAQLAVINVDFNAEDSAVAAEVENEAALYKTIHEMSNTKIIAEDGRIWGVKAMTKVRVENVQNALKTLGIKDERLTQILDRWAKQDFSQCIEDHNYVWSNYLNGTIGKAVKLR
jgi:hypothetical protein